LFEKRLNNREGEDSIMQRDCGMFILFLLSLQAIKDFSEKNRRRKALQTEAKATDQTIMNFCNVFNTKVMIIGTLNGGEALKTPLNI
jgi:hypothetical protein